MTIASAEHGAEKETLPEEGAGASAALASWIMTKEGRRVWAVRHGTLSVDQICHILDETYATSYVLLLSARFTTILSSLDHNRFQEKVTEYEAAIESGLCFWYDGRVLHYIPKSSQALERIRTLPPSTTHKRHD